MGGGVSVFSTLFLSVPPCGDPWAALLKCWLNLTIFSVLDLHVLSTGYRLIVSLISCQGCTPAAVLYPSQGRSSSCAHRAGLLNSVWYMASWNVRTLLDMEGSVETAKQSYDTGLVADERKIDQVVDELKRYRVCVAALQETKWFSAEVYEVGESVVLTSGRPVPEVDQCRQRGEGVAIILRGSAVSAWKRGGNQWRA